MDTVEYVRIPVSGLASLRLLLSSFLQVEAEIGMLKESGAT